MAGPRKRCFKSCSRWKAAALSRQWNSIHSHVSITATQKSKWVLVRFEVFLIFSVKKSRLHPFAWKLARKMNGRQNWWDSRRPIDPSTHKMCNFSSQLIKLASFNITIWLWPPQIVKQMPTMASNKQPTIAVVTAQYCEKVAVDAMLENKETFVRYTTVGKWFNLKCDAMVCFNYKLNATINWQRTRLRTNKQLISINLWKFSWVLINKN